MQPAASGIDSTGVKLLKGEVLSGALVPVNEEKFWKKRTEEVPVDEVYFQALSHVDRSLTDKGVSSYSSTNSFRRKMRRRERKQLRLINEKIMMMLPPQALVGD